MTVLDDAADLLLSRRADVVATFAVTSEAAYELAAEACELLGIDPAGTALDAADVPAMRLVVDVVAWRAAEAAAALNFDFSADGGSYQRSQLAEQARDMRVCAEDRAAAAGLVGFTGPVVEYYRPVARSEARCD